MQSAHKYSSQRALQAKAAGGRQAPRPLTGVAGPQRVRASAKAQQRDDSLDREIGLMNHGLHKAKQRAMDPGLSPTRVLKPQSPQAGPALHKAQSMRTFQPNKQPDTHPLAALKSPERTEKPQPDLGTIFSKKKRDSPALVQAAAYQPDNGQPATPLDLEKNNKRIAKENQSLLDKMKDAFKHLWLRQFKSAEQLTTEDLDSLKKDRAIARTTMECIGSRWCAGCARTNSSRR